MMASKTKLRCGGRTHPGLVRSNNEDRIYCDSSRGILLVVDGIGGHAAGEKAADVAVDLIRSRLERETGSPGDRIREAITVANNEIYRLASTNRDWRGMACVLTLALIEDGMAVIGHVGDSRLYKLRSGQIHKVTHDHSPVGEREDSNDLSESDAMRHPRRNEVYRDVGTEEHAPDDLEFIELLQIPFEDDSALLLCSDGLSDQVTSREILSTVERHAGDISVATEALVDAANLAGGKDNVSVVIAEGPHFGSIPGAPGGAMKQSTRSLLGRAVLFVSGLATGALLVAVFLRFGQSRQEMPSPASESHRILTVGSAGDAQFSSIAGALAGARPGDTVEVLSGEYREQVVLREGIRLSSRLPRTAILRAPPGVSGPISVTAEGIKHAEVAGLRILADQQLPLTLGVLLVNSEVELDDCEIAGAGTGIEIRGNANPILRANSVHDNTGIGILISGKSAPRLSHNDIVRNGRKAGGSLPGILISGDAQPVLEGNIFAGNGSQAIVVPGTVDPAPILKFNFFQSGEPIGHPPAESPQGLKQRRRRP